jgi:TatD DNase family protein
LASLAESQILLVDSHCHLDFPEFAEQMPALRERMRANGVTHALCVNVTMEDRAKVLALAEQYGNFFASVGVHPDYPNTPENPVHEPSVAELVAFAKHPKVVAIGETGLDYFRLTGDLEWQRVRFRTHIRAAVDSAKPLIIHTRAASSDTIAIMKEECADRCSGVMHCFTEDWDTAKAALDLGFYISISGIATFKNAESVRDVARRVPLNRLLVETDSPYLAPIPHRGKTNEPSFVRHLAERLAQERQMEFSDFCCATTDNFFNLFNTIERKLHVS